LKPGESDPIKPSAVGSTPAKTASMIGASGAVIGSAIKPARIAALVGAATEAYGTPVGKPGVPTGTAGMSGLNHSIIGLSANARTSLLPCSHMSKPPGMTVLNGKSIFNCKLETVVLERL